MVEQIIDFDVAREAMVECQVLPGGVRDTKLCRVLKKIPREAYVPEKYKVRFKPTNGLKQLLNK